MAVMVSANGAALVALEKTVMEPNVICAVEVEIAKIKLRLDTVAVVLGL